MPSLRFASDPKTVATEMLDFMRELFPICRSITGDGIRATLAAIGDRIPLEVHEVPSGTEVFDWTVPKEWNISDAYIADASGRRVVDFKDHNLHVMGYSIPIDKHLSLEELKAHVHSLPDQPNVIPFRTSYYSETWGFCMQYERLQALPDGEYDAKIESSLQPGSLSYGECFLPGALDDEVLISCHCCHPSIANDNLSGIALATELARLLANTERRYSYRFLFIPGTIGSVTWLALNQDRVDRIKHGLVVTCVGDAGRPTYKRSRRGNALIDRATVHVLAHSGRAYEVRDFSPYGYDERQYCSPGFNLAVGSLTRTPHGEYREYHTSADNLDFVSPESLVDSLVLYMAVLDVIEKDASYVNLFPKGEVQLGKRGLYPSVGAQGTTMALMARLWVLNLSDGDHSLLDIAERAGLPFSEIHEAAQLLIEGGVLAPS